MNQLYDILSGRKNPFSDFWFAYAKTRFVLCVVVLFFSISMPPGSNLRMVFATVGVYFCLNLALGLLAPNKLQLKRVRLVSTIVDVVFTSCLVFLTGGEKSPWFLLYFFPVLSITRYLSYEGSIPLALLATTAYAVSALAVNTHIDGTSLVLKGMFLLSVALIAGNLNKRSRKEKDLVETFMQIDSAILNHPETDQVLNLILNKALTLTNSDFAQMQIFDEGYRGPKIAVNANPSQPYSHVSALTQRYSEEVFQSRRPLTIATIKNTTDHEKTLLQDNRDREEPRNYIFPAYTEAENLTGSALFVPLVLNEKVKAVIFLYSKHRFHYSQSEAANLSRFAPLFGIALSHSQMYREITDSEIEKKQRLKMLYSIAEQLRVERGLSELFEWVVEMTCTQLNSEEAALFVRDEASQGLIQKVAVKGPISEITAKLGEIEKSYIPGENSVGRIFQTRQIEHWTDVPSYLPYYDNYSETLPSRSVRHYIGVPLIIGDEVLGVLRVINKRAFSYSVENASFELSDNGFDSADVELLETIASQVAAAIRSAKFLEVRRYYEELVGNSPDPIIVLDDQGRVKVFNRACETIWGFSAGEVIGQHVTRYYESESHARDTGRLLERSPNHRIQDYPANIRDRHGEIIPISLSASLLFDNEGKRMGSIGVFKDLRETLKLQEQRMNAERLSTVGRLAHTVGHEIKHNIATALNYVDTLAYESAGDDELSEIYRDIQDSLRKAVGEFQNMLLVGRPRRPEKEIIDFKDLLRGLEASMRRRAVSRGIEFLVNYPDGDYELDADATQLRQVFLNLIDNSIDAIEVKRYREAVGEKGQIKLSAHADNGYLQVIWRDNGCGITAQTIPNIFTPFVTDKPNGTGLGLYIVKSIIENHGGNISVASEEGIGTSFTIAIPLSSC